MDTSGQDIQGTVDSMKNMIDAMLYTVRDQIKTLEIAAQQLEFFREQRQGEAPKEEL